MIFYNICNIKKIFLDLIKVTEILYSVVSKYTTQIEAVSCDELYIDASNFISSENISPERLAEMIRSDFSSESNLQVSIGIGQNRLLARMATNIAKPNGVYHVTGDGRDFMLEVPLKNIPNIGHQLHQKLKEKIFEAGVNFGGELLCSHLLQIDASAVKDAIGVARGEKLIKNCQGICEEELNFEKIRKSISAEINYGIRFKNWIMAEDFLICFVRYVFQKYKKSQMESRKLTVKLHYREPDAGFEPVKYGGMGHCNGITKSIDVIPRKFTEDFFLSSTVSILKGFQVRQRFVNPI